MSDKIKIIFGLIGLAIIGYLAVVQLKRDFRPQNNQAAIVNIVNSDEGMVLPVRWGNLGSQLIKAGVIDKEKFESLYRINGKLDTETEKLISGTDNGNIRITSRNSALILNLLWAFGLGNKNEILEKGPMADPRYGGIQNFASTGGWTLADGSAMEHYSKHLFIILTPEQQALVEKVSKSIYRPCCGNSTYFPDCNHGIAMLGLLELLAWQNASEDQMYQVALQMNNFWFPDQYATIAKYLESKGLKLQDVNPKEILGINYSSASGYAKVESSLPREQNQGGGSCGV